MKYLWLLGFDSLRKRQSFPLSKLAVPGKVAVFQCLPNHAHAHAHDATGPLRTLPLGLKMAFFLQSPFKKEMILEIVLFSHLNLNVNVCVFKVLYRSVIGIQKLCIVNVCNLESLEVSTHPWNHHHNPRHVDISTTSQISSYPFYYYFISSSDKHVRPRARQYYHFYST